MESLVYLQKSVLYQKTVEKSREKSKTVWSPEKKNSTDLMNLFLIWILISIRKAFQRYTTWPDCEVTECYHRVNDTKSAILNMTLVA